MMVKTVLLNQNHHDLTDVIFPYQVLPRMLDHELEIPSYFKGRTNGVDYHEAVKAIAVRHLLVDTYGEDNYPFQESMTPHVLAQEIHQERVYTFFFVVKNKVAGTASVVPDGHGGAEFGRTAIHRNYRRFGIGDLLLNARITFTSLFKEQLDIKWFYTTARTSNIRIQDIWIRSPHSLKVAALSPLYKLANQEFSTIFVRHFGNIEKTQQVVCVDEARSLIEAIMTQYNNCGVEWNADVHERVSVPDDYDGYFTKRYICSRDVLVSEVTRFSTPYCELAVPTNITGTLDIQHALIREGFIPTGFYPGFNGFPPFLTFGKLNDRVTTVQEALFPESILKEPIGEILLDVYRKFSNTRTVAKGDPFK